MEKKIYKIYSIFYSLIESSMKLYIDILMILFNPRLDLRDNKLKSLLLLDEEISYKESKFHILRIESKINKLKSIFIFIIQNDKKNVDKLDGVFASALFGCFDHQFRLSPVLSENEIQEFENQHKIKLPPDYRAFISTICNGGAGPYYGLYSLSFWNDYLTTNNPNQLSIPFIHVDEWNSIRPNDVEDEVEVESENRNHLFDMEYYDDKWITGSICICHYGCGVFYRLVVSGEEYGKVWIDDRGSDNGIYPALNTETKKHLTFSEWYENWLDHALNGCFSKIRESI